MRQASTALYVLGRNLVMVAVLGVAKSALDLPLVTPFFVAGILTLVAGWALAYGPPLLAALPHRQGEPAPGNGRIHGGWSLILAGWVLLVWDVWAAV